MASILPSDNTKGLHIEIIIPGLRGPVDRDLKQPPDRGERAGIYQLRVLIEANCSTRASAAKRKSSTWVSARLARP